VFRRSRGGAIRWPPSLIGYPGNPGIWRGQPEVKPDESRRYVLGQASTAIAPPNVDEPRINERIRAREVRLVAPDGEQIGIKPLPEALTIARSMGLDLVEVAPEARPPVCRIMDYGKFKYENAQRAKESRRKSSHGSLKEMKYRPKISIGDFNTKTRKVEKFLGQGNKVKITIMFRGREMAHPERGMEILDRVADAVSHVGKVDQTPKLDGRNMTMVLSPDKRAQAAASRRERENESENDGARAESTPTETA